MKFGTGINATPQQTIAGFLLEARNVSGTVIRRCGGPRFDQSRIRTGPGFAFVTNVVSVSNTSSIEIILLSRTS